MSNFMIMMPCIMSERIHQAVTGFDPLQVAGHGAWHDS